MSEPSSGIRPAAEPLPAPVVPSDTYDDHYFRKVCLGASEWSESDGRRAAGVYPGFLKRAELRGGEVVVDFGTGRGELLAVAIEEGASRAVGFEYAAAAVQLARRTLDAHGVGDAASVFMADARAIPLRGDVADLVTMIDVVEHLAPDELALTLREAFRVLRPGGRIVIHTTPSRTIYETTYRLLRSSRARWRRTWPADPRNDYERAMHVNEQTVTSLGRTLRHAGFRPARATLGLQVYTQHVPDARAKRVYHLLAKVPLLARLGVADIWARGVKPGG